MEPQEPEVIDLTRLSLSSPDGSSRETSHPMSEDASIPWYQVPQSSHPFSLAVKLRATHASASPFIGLEFFPWGDTHLGHLWNGGYNAQKENSLYYWQWIRSKWRNAAAVCGAHIIRLINTSPQQQGTPIFQISLPADCRFTVSHVKWALNPKDLHPLILYVHSSVLHVFDVEARSFLGCIRGHGANITSLGVHRTHPHIVSTTSRDFTTRIYDLRVVSVPKPHDISRERRKSILGHATTDDGNSRIGKCVVVLTGGRSGGHEAAVLGADFHPSLPLIATCGLDHAVRIWHLKPQLFLPEEYPREEADVVDTEDKPLFSSSLIHDAPVLSVYWLSLDLLVSYSAPQTCTARMTGRSGDTGRGTLAVWQWLSVGRFFPPDTPVHGESPLRGCISDYRESWKASFKMLSLSLLPVDVSRMSVYSTRNGPPLILITVRSKILLVDASRLPPRNRPVLRDDRDEFGKDLAPQSKRIRLSGAMTEDLYTDIEGWALSTVIGEDLEDDELEGCELSVDGRRVMAVGSREGIWMWSAT